MKQWDPNDWLKRFNHAGVDYRSLRREVWQNTLDIVQQGGYTLPDGTCVRVGKGWEMTRHSRMYHEPIQPKPERSEHDTRITVSPSDCLDVAHEWVQSGKEVSVLNMANRQNPGGGVLLGAGAQEEYLFRCTNYFRSMFRYVDYAHQYGLTRSHWSYPLDRNHGGIYTPGVTVFRTNEQQGYALLDEPWRVNMISVAGMNNPRLVDECGETRIASELVEGVKNKIRTIFRIAIDNHQGNLVLGALGCGAFHNPPRHVAELFRDVLCEKEFEGAFENICFAVKADHNSRGDSNYIAFRDVLDGFNPTDAKLEDRSMIPIRKVTLADSGIVVMREDGSADYVDLELRKWNLDIPNLRDIDCVADGFDRAIGLRKGKVALVYKNNWEIANQWVGVESISACEGHYGMVTSSGKVFCADNQGYGESEAFSDIVREWSNIEQLEVTYDEPYALTREGSFFCRDDALMTFFNDPGKPRIREIAAFQCFFSMLTVAALYDDGTVKAFWNEKEIEDTRNWEKVRKICCGNHGAVIGLAEGGKLLIPSGCEFRDRAGREYAELEGVKDMDARYDYLVVLREDGEILLLENK